MMKQKKFVFSLMMWSPFYFSLTLSLYSPYWNGEKGNLKCFRFESKLHYITYMKKKWFGIDFLPFYCPVLSSSLLSNRKKKNIDRLVGWLYEPYMNSMWIFFKNQSIHTFSIKCQIFFCWKNDRMYVWPNQQKKCHQLTSF